VTKGRQSFRFVFSRIRNLRASGLNEKEAQAKGISYRLFKVPMEVVLRARHTFRKREGS